MKLIKKIEEERKQWAERREQIKINLLSQNNLAFQIRLTTFLHVLEAYVHSMDYIILCNITTCVCFDLAPLATSSACSDFLRILDRAPNLSILTLRKENFG